MSISRAFRNARLAHTLNFLDAKTIQESVDTSGNTGDIIYDNNFVYIKTTDGWKRASISSFATPSDISGLQLWLDASDATTLYDATIGGSLVTADGAVKRWEDKSGNDRHATEATNGPARKAAEQNGLDALLFDGVNDALTINYNIVGLNAITFFVVAKQAGTLDDSSMAIGNYGITSGTDGITCYLGQSDSAFAVSGRPTSSSNSYTVAGSGSESLEFIVGTGIFSNGSLFARTNGASLATASVSAGNLVGESSLEIAHLSAFSIYYKIQVAEILIYDSALSDADREAVENYLMTKWGIS